MSRDRLFLPAVLASFAALAALGTAASFHTHDELWFTQLTARVAAGDSLYGDVFYGAGPLPVYAVLPLAAAFGAHVAWVKLVQVACFAATLVLVALLVRRLGGSRASAIALAAAVFVFAPPHRSAPYQQLATLCLLATLVLVLAWVERRERTALVLAAGAAAGLAFASKQDVGVYALAALLGSIVLAARAGRVRAAGIALAGFAGSVALMLVPVAATGGLARYVEYGFTAKGRYVSSGGVSYLGGLRARADAARDALAAGAGDAVYAVLPGYEVVLYLVVPAVLAVLAAAWWRTEGDERRRVAVVGLFAAAGFVAIFPRAVSLHVSFVAPVLLVAGWYALAVLARDLPDRRARLVALVLVVALVPGVAVRAAWPVLRVADAGARPADLPHVRGILVEPEREAAMRETADALAREAANGPLLLLTPEAGFYYLLAGVESPTPYDYPLVTAFGGTGEADLAAAIRRGEIATVCMRYRGEGGLTPERLVRAVEQTMERGERLPACRLYRLPRLLTIDVL